MSNIEYPFVSFAPAPGNTSMNLEKKEPTLPVYKPFTPPVQAQQQTENNDFGFSFFHENEIEQQVNQAATSAAAQTEMTYKQKLAEVEAIIVPFLNNLMKDPEKVMIKWPNRKQVVEAQLKKVLSITKS